MFKISLLVLSFIIAENVSALPIYCTGKNHKVSVSEDNKKAKVYNREGKPAPFGRLNCTSTFLEKTHPEGTPILYCRTETIVPDAGLGLYIYRPAEIEEEIEEEAEVLLGRLSSQSIVGPRVVDHLKCVRVFRSNSQTDQ